MAFEPIAIVGRSCVLPGALTPERFWEAVSQGENLTGTAPKEHWQLRKDSVLTSPERPKQDHAWSDRGGYVTGFERVFNPKGFQGLSEEQVLGLDPLFQWVLHGVREALSSAGLGPVLESDSANTGLILGNLSYPSSSLTKLAEQSWYEENQFPVSFDEAVSPVNRFCSGYPAHLAASALGLTGDAYSLDAACASSLYAIKLACDQLQDRRADLMVAGAVNRADDLFIKIGFCALSAMSRAGVSRPFDKNADGLLPAEGAAFVVLKRLSDAKRDNDCVLGVIRGIGLSNDGRSGGFLAPSKDGQIRAMKSAYENSGIDPRTISLLECHATGTPVGDKIEIESSSQIFSSSQELPIGSLKSNMGHLITVAGLAGMLKILAAMEHKTRPPSLHVEDRLEVFEGSPFRVLSEAEAWESEGPRRAGLSAFGFGGNNAHVIIEEWNPEAVESVSDIEMPPKLSDDSVAIVAIEARIPGADPEGMNWSEFEQSLFKDLEETHSRIDEIKMMGRGLRFPPNDLNHCLPQQLLMLELARRVADKVPSLSEGANRSSVLIGMGVDPEISRYAARWRVADRAHDSGHDLPEDVLKGAQNAFVHGLEAAGVIGTMPNIPANRINSQLNFQGPSYTVSSEELSGLRALDIAERALREGDIDGAIVGAVDLSAELVHKKAMALFPNLSQASDGAVALVLKRVSDAERDGDTIYATLSQTGFENAEDSPNLDARLGHSHASYGLLKLAAAISATFRSYRMEAGAVALTPVLEQSPAPVAVTVSAMGEQESRWRVSAAKKVDDELKLCQSARKIFAYSGVDRADLLRALEQQEESESGPSRLVITAKDMKEWQARAAQAKRALESGAAKFSIAPGVYYSAAPLEGEMGYVFTGAAAAYPGMGRELLGAFPHLGPRLLQRYPSLTKAAHWLDPRNTELSDNPFEVLHGCSFLCQAHSELTRHFIQRKPEAALGVSSGETNSMFALGAWSDFEAMFQEIYDSGMYQEQIAGEFQCALKSWQDEQVTDIHWTCWRILAPVDKVQAIVDEIPFVNLTMINTSQDCVIGGQDDACKKVIEKIGARFAFPLGHDIIAHSPEMKAWRDPWYKLHHRETQSVEGVRFYSNSFGTHYQANADQIADALTGQALKCVDFRAVVEAAWNDGVRIFVEHGPRGSCAAWIQQILGERPHLAVALDRPGAGTDQFIDGMAQLLAAGVPIKTESLQFHFDKNRHSPKLRSYPAHYPAVRLPVVPEKETAVQVMAPAPALPSVFENASAAVAPRPITPQAAPVATPPLAAPNAPRPLTPPTASPAPASSVVIPAYQTAMTQSPPASAAPTVQQTIGAQLVQFHQSLAAAHNHFLAMQGQVTQQLLGLRAGQSLPQGPAPQAALQVAQAVTAPAPVTPAPSPVLPANPVSPEAPTQTLIKPRPVTPAAAAPTQPAVELAPAVLPGPKIDREGLKVLASGKISDILGPLFQKQDDYRRQVRMPEPPLLLADRVTGIESAPGSMGKGRIWTETDVVSDSWYLHYGRMPTGIMIESGQADLLLISWLGADFENRGERVYRLLGCELTFHEGGLPTVGDTLVYDIKIDGYAQQGPIRLFFFHYDCLINDKSRLSVRHGQAGFFTDEELANSAGILWSAEEAEPDPQGVVDAPVLRTDGAFSSEQVKAFSEGKVVECFGPEFEMSKVHVRTPKISSGRMLLFDEVLEFNPQGGPWQRGYLKAVDHLANDEWFFDGHFKNDPCMPGTLMFEGCIQTMSFYLAAMGVTLDRDGWLFEPVPEETYKLRCRGQVTPGARLLEYEVFVEEFIAGPIPVLKADLLCTVDGLKAFHCKGMKLRLRPAWPLESRPALMDTVERGDDSKIAAGPDISFDFYSLAACAWGQPTHAFGSMYGIYDSERRCPRLPGPPYHFMSRITQLNAHPHTKKSGGTIEVEYDIPPDAWYFSENGRRVMPYCVLLEAALQPCGWLASFIGCALGIDEDVFFRNLDGTSTLFEDIHPDSGTLRTTVKSTNVSQAGPMIIVSFEVQCFLEDRKVYEMKTAFGFFPGESLAAQVGLPATPEDRARIEGMNGRHQWLRARPADLFHGDFRLPGPMLMLLDSILEYNEEGGENQLGTAAAEIAVETDQWFFKSHFYGDPVQPGSLGIEAMLQLFQWLMLEKKLGGEIKNPRFESIQLGSPMTWKYRGQVVPTNKRVVLEIEITEQTAEAGSVTVTGNASYWCDGIRIYEATNIGMRIVSGDSPTLADGSERLDPAKEPWLGDHCPTWTAPALAMMSMVDRLAGGAVTRAPGREVRAVKNVQVSRWLSFDRGPRELQVHGVPRRGNEVHTELFAWDESKGLFETVARGEVIVAEENHLAPKAWSRIEDGVLQEDPYESGVLFHGPRYQALKELYLGASGSTCILDADPGEVPFGTLNQRLLDAATHGIPHDRLSLWSSEIPEDMVAYPVSIPEARFYGPAPRSGLVRCEARFRGFKGGQRFPWISLQLIVEGEERAWAEIELVEALFPKGPLGSAKAEHRRAFLGESVFVPELSLSTLDKSTASLNLDTVKESDWLEGSLTGAYQSKAKSGMSLVREIAVKECLAHRMKVHPSLIDVPDDLPEQGTIEIKSAAQPLHRYELELTGEGETAEVQLKRDFFEVDALKGPWRGFLGIKNWFGEDLFFALVKQFIASVTMTHPREFAALKGRGVLFVANHQVGVESPLFGIVTSALQELPTSVIAKQEHKDSWIGHLFDVCFDRDDVSSPELLALVDRDNQKDVIQTIGKRFERLKQNKECLLIHVEGTRSVQGGQRVEVVSSAVIDLAVSLGIPVVPARFADALPKSDALEARREFPFAYSRQRLCFGEPLLPEALKSKTSLERRNRVLEALNAICGGPEAEDEPVPNVEFDKAVKDWREQRSVTEIQAVLFQALKAGENLSDESKALIEAASGAALKELDSVSLGWLKRCYTELFGLSL